MAISNKKKKNKSKIESWISTINSLEKYILDDENAIIITSAGNRTSDPGYYMIHKRLENDKLVEINKFYLKNYFFGNLHSNTVIKDLNLFKVQGEHEIFDSIYDYKKGCFIVPKGDWNVLEFGTNDSLIKKYNCIFATLTLSSDFDDSDIYTYASPVNGKTVVESFSVTDGIYHAILNTDGTIRGKKLFKGASLSSVEKVIDLKNYESLSAFKEQRKKLCNDRKKREKQKYYKQLFEKTNEDLPYLNTEVLKVLNLKK